MHQCAWDLDMPMQFHRGRRLQKEAHHWRESGVSDAAVQAKRFSSNPATVAGEVHPEQKAEPQSMPLQR